MKKDQLKKDVIYRLTNSLDGLKICILESNRNNAAKNKAMKDACLEVGMQAPGILADARLAKEAGYQLRDVKDNHIVSDAEVDDYLVIGDGNTRFHGWLLALEEGKSFDYTFQYKKYGNPAELRRAYLKMNVCNTPTSTADFARDIEATTQNPIIKSYRSKIADGLTPKAAGYAVIGREIQKNDIKKLQEDNIPSGFNDTEKIEALAHIYSQLTPIRQLRPALFKGAEVWQWNAEHLNDASDKCLMAEQIIEMFNTMPPMALLQFQNAKKEGNRSKAVVVKDLLDSCLKSMIAVKLG